MPSNTNKIPTASRAKRAKPATAGASTAGDSVVATPSSTPAIPSKLDQLIALLTASPGTTLDAMIAATGWQAHSVRGAMAGALKKRGLTVTSDKTDGVRTYRASVAA